jgi:hypothetical protein
VQQTNSVGQRINRLFFLAKNPANSLIDLLQNIAETIDRGIIPKIKIDFHGSNPLKDTRKKKQGETVPPV